MTTLYLDLGMGAAGDMLTAALLELLPQRRDEFLQIMNNLGLPGVSVTAEPSVKCGITGTHVSVTVHGVDEQSLDVDEAAPGPHHHAGGDHDHAHADGHGHAEHHHHHDADHQHAEHNHDLPGHEHDHEHGHHHDHEDVVHGDHGHRHPHEHSEELHERSESPHEHDHEHGSGEHGHTHSHSSFPHVVEVVNRLDIPERARVDAIAVYRQLAEAEAAVHGMPVEQVHFHEVGEADAIADIVGACLLMSWLAPERVLASAVHVGSGKVRCAHGIVPVPAPATERLLRGIPVFGGTVRGELCTPTGAALLKHFVDEFVPAMPAMTVELAGYGMGTKDFEAANCVRALIGETADPGSSDDVVELSCNLDDMTGESIGYAQQQLFAAGAIEVFTTAVSMKKGRPGLLLTCLCPPALRDDVVRAIFQHTTTIGVREHLCHRYTLDRTEETVQTPYGEVRVKAVSGYGVRRGKPEYDDLAAIADRERLSLDTVSGIVGESWRTRQR